MTPRIAAELNELGLTEAELQERTRAITEQLHSEPNGKQRKKRSDAGVPKPVKAAPAPPGALTDAQAAELKGLAEAMVSSAKDLVDAQRRNLLACVAHAAYIDSLTRK